MNTRKLFSLLTLSAPALLLTPSVTLAQPNANNAPIAQNPPNQAPGGGGGRGNRGGRGGGANLTDAQRQQFEAQNRQLREIAQRQRLSLAGVTDSALQDAVIAYLGETETARQKLRDGWNTLLTAVRDQTTTDSQLAALLNDFRGAVEDEKTRRETARAGLETKLGLAKNPRLDAQLMTSGLLGEEAAFVEGGQGRGGRGGRGGFGGGPGGFGGF